MNITEDFSSKPHFSVNSLFFFTSSTPLKDWPCTVFSPPLPIYLKPIVTYPLDPLRKKEADLSVLNASTCLLFSLKTLSVEWKIVCAF